MRLGTFLRHTANALSSFLLAAGLMAQTAPSSTAPVSAVEKALQVISFGAVTSVDCSTNAATIATCLGGPITDSGTLTFTFATQTAGQLLLGPASGSAAVPAFRNMSDAVNDFKANKIATTICKMTSLLEANNTAAETTIFSCSIPANSMGADGDIHAVFFGDLLYNNAGTETFQIKIKIGCPSSVAACAGGQEVFDGTSPSTTATATRGPWKFDIDVMNMNATNSQLGVSQFTLGSISAAPTKGIGSFSGGVMFAGGRPMGLSTTSGTSTAATVDTTATQFLVVTVKWNTANAGLIFTSRGGYAQLFP